VKVDGRLLLCRVEFSAVSSREVQVTYAIYSVAIQYVFNTRDVDGVERRDVVVGLRLLRHGVINFSYLSC